MNGIQLTNYIPEVKVRHDAHGKIIGGLVVGNTLHQNQALLLTLHPGELKGAPAVGCGLADMLLDHNPLMWRAVIRDQMEMDGQRVDRITVTRYGVDIESQ